MASGSQPFPRFLYVVSLIVSRCRPHSIRSEKVAPHDWSSLMPRIATAMLRRARENSLLFGISIL